MKKIIFYISDHGKGHATRSIAIIRELQKLDTEIIVRNFNSVDLIQKSLPDTKVISGTTDIGTTIKKNGIAIDSEVSPSEISAWIDNIPNYANKELDHVLKYNPDLVITDISAMPFHVAKKLQIPSIAISNFTWSDVITGISSERLSFLHDSYSLAHMAIQLPFGTSMKQFSKKKKIGVVARQPTSNKEEIKKRFKIKSSEKCVFFSLGNSKDEYNCKISCNLKVLTNGIKLKNSLNTLQVSDYIEQQNLVLGADLVICKCGYGLISECVTTGTPFLYVYDSNHLEQASMVNELRRRRIGKAISMEDLNNLNLSEELFVSAKKFPKEPIDTASAIQYIHEFL